MNIRFPPHIQVHDLEQALAALNLTISPIPDASGIYTAQTIHCTQPACTNRAVINLDSGTFCAACARQLLEL